MSFAARLGRNVAGGGFEGRVKVVHLSAVEIFSAAWQRAVPTQTAFDAQKFKRPVNHQETHPLSASGEPLGGWK